MAIRRNQKREEFVVIGLGRFGSSVAETLVGYGHNVLAMDNNMERVQHLSTTLPHVVQLDATSIHALRQAGVDHFANAIVCIGSDFESNLLATVLLQRLGLKRIITKARTRTQKEILTQIGAHEVILPEYEAGVRLARRMAAGHFVDYLEVSEDVGIVELVTPPSIEDHTLAECNLRQRYDLTAVAIRRGDEIIVSPSASFRLISGDILVVLGKIADAERLNE